MRETFCFTYIFVKSLKFFHFISVKQVFVPFVKHSYSYSSWFFLSEFWILIFDFDFWSLISDFWSLIPDLWFLFPDFWSLIPDLWFLISNLWSLISDFFFKARARRAPISIYSLWYCHVGSGSEAWTSSLLSSKWG